MPKVILPLGIDPDLFTVIEEKRGNEHRTAFINKKLREILMPAVQPSTAQTAGKATP